MKGLSRAARWNLTVWSGAVLLVAAAAYARVAWIGWSEWGAGRSALATGKTEEALDHLDRALQLYLPWGGASEASAMELLRLGERLREQGNRRLALEAYRAVRSGLYGARRISPPHPEWIALCDQQMARLISELPETDLEKGLGADERYRRALIAMVPPSRPRPAGTLMVLVGLAGWIGATFGLIWRGLGRSPARLGPALLWGMLTLGFYLFWLFGLVRA